MTIDEAIKHIEEVAKKQENNAKNYPRPDKSIKGSGRKYNAYLKCAEEHRQLAEWLKDYKRLLEQEPKTGHWVLTDDDLVYCSECEDSYYPRPIDASWYYCPHCGAKME